jgi:hypothetical protein
MSGATLTLCVSFGLCFLDCVFICSKPLQMLKLCVDNAMDISRRRRNVALLLKASKQLQLVSLRV